MATGWHYLHYKGCVLKRNFAARGGVGGARDRPFQIDRANDVRMFPYEEISAATRMKTTHLYLDIQKSTTLCLDLVHPHLDEWNITCCARLRSREIKLPKFSLFHPVASLR